MHWWSDREQPFPRIATIARRIGCEPRTVQRALNNLKSLGLISWERVQVQNGKIVTGATTGAGIRRRQYDLSGLVAAAQKFAAHHASVQNGQHRGAHQIAA